MCQSLNLSLLKYTYLTLMLPGRRDAPLYALKMAEKARNILGEQGWISGLVSGAGQILSRRKASHGHDHKPYRGPVLSLICLLRCCSCGYPAPYPSHTPHLKLTLHLCEVTAHIWAATGPYAHVMRITGNCIQQSIPNLLECINDDGFRTSPLIDRFMSCLEKQGCQWRWSDVGGKGKKGKKSKRDKGKEKKIPFWKSDPENRIVTSLSAIDKILIGIKAGP